MTAIIVYHDKCHDGITAAWCAKQRYPDAELYAANYSTPPDLERLRGKDVIIVDFSWKRGVMLKVSKVAKSVLVLDHHASAERELAPGGKFLALKAPTLDGFRNNCAQDDFENANIDGAVIYTVFDMNRSGAGLAWDVLVGGPRPRLVDAVEDRDLWRFALPDTRELHAALGSYPLDYATREVLMREGSTHAGLSAFVTEGRAIMRYHDQLVDAAVKTARPMRFPVLDGAEVTVPSVNLPLLTLVSDVLGRLAVGQPFAVSWFEVEPGDAQVSLRSAPDGYDVSRIAERFGGGGHPRAAGCRMRTSQLYQPASREEQVTA